MVKSLKKNKSSRKANLLKKKINNMSTNDILNEISDKYNKNINKIKDDYKDFNINDEKEQSKEGYMQIALVEAEKLWFQLQCMLVTNQETYMKLRDDEKIDLFKNDFDQFQNEFPIVSRWMICMGQYKRKAFEKYLKKCKNSVIDEKKRKEDKNYMRNQWLERQADYIKYLWEESQNGRINRKESKKIWQQAYQSLKSEFDDFENLYDDIEVKVKKDEIKNKNEMLYELVDRINTTDQKLKEDKALKLYNYLLLKKYKQNYSETLDQLLNNVKTVKPSHKGLGTNKKAKEKMLRDKQIKELENKKKIM